MIAFETLTGVAAPLPESDIDTDVIFPARFLLLLDKAGLGKLLFHERRFGGGGPRPEFVLNRSPYDAARILVAGRNFGSGSSREQAVWALADFGIRCVVARASARSSSRTASRTASCRSCCRPSSTRRSCALPRPGRP